MEKNEKYLNEYDRISEYIKWRKLRCKKVYNRLSFVQEEKNKKVYLQKNIERIWK